METEPKAGNPDAFYCYMGLSDEILGLDKKGFLRWWAQDLRETRDLASKQLKGKRELVIVIRVIDGQLARIESELQSPESPT